MLLLAKHGVLTRGVVGVEKLQHTIVYLITIARKRHIVLLVYGLQLGVETTDYIVLEAVCLHLRPILNLV